MGQDRTHTMSPPSGGELLRERQERSWSRRRAALELRRAAQATGLHLPELESIEKSIARHEKGSVRPDQMYSSLYRAIYEMRNDEQHANGKNFTVASHKFTMACVAPEDAATLSVGAQEVEDAWFPCVARQLDSPFGSGHLYVWPTGAVAYHLREARDWDSLCGLAAWRVQTYERNLRWFGEWLTEALGTTNDASYVLSAYWVDEPAWAPEELTTAVHLLSVPKTLLTSSHEAQSRDVEHELMTAAWRHPDVIDYGVDGISVGAASWSGIAYAPTDPERALSEDDLVRCELGVQALWAYCDHITRTDEAGRPVRTHPDHGHAWLRRARSRLTIARAQESGQHRSMRAAIVATSGVGQIIDNAIEILKDQ